MEIAEFYIDDAYLVRTSGTSDGTQDKYFKDNLWFKADRFGGEGLAEAATSRILKSSGFDSSKYVEYTPCLINGKQGCFSRNFLNNEESFITLYRLYKNVTGRDLAEVCSRMDFDDAIEYVISFVKDQTGIDIHEYLANIFELDRIILNEDRHFNNMGLIYSGTTFRTAPLFDNGKSFLIGSKRASEKISLKEKIAGAYSKAFSPSFNINARYLKNYCTLHITKNCLNDIKNIATDGILNILNYTLGEE